MYHARGVVTLADIMSGEQKKELKALEAGDEITKVWKDNWYDGLTYCKLERLGEADNPC